MQPEIFLWSSSFGCRFAARGHFIIKLVNGSVVIGKEVLAKKVLKNCVWRSEFWYCNAISFEAFPLPSALENTF